MSDDGEETMSDVYLGEAFPKVGANAKRKYGLLDLWEFFCELLEISDEKPAVNYPITVFRFGNVPLKAPSKSGITSVKKQSNIPMLHEDFSMFDEDFGSEFVDGYEDTDDFEEDYYDDSLDDEDLK